MKKLIILLVLLPFFLQPVMAADFTAPTVPEDGQAVFPKDPTSFSQGLAEILKDCAKLFRPALADCFQSCLKVFAIVMLSSLLTSQANMSKKSISLACVLAIAVLLLSPANQLIYLGRNTILQITEYGKLLLPVMAGALAAQGAASSAAALYAGTAFINALLGSLISDLLIPMVYIFLLLAAACGIVEEKMLVKIKAFAKWCMTWSLKLLLYGFTGYMSITGVISGAVDASAIKAAKITISGVVPVVGGILSDASEAILLSAGVMKNSAGVYGILALLSILVGPFIKIGVQYLSLKATGAVCQVFSSKECSGLLDDFTSAMGLLLAMTATACLLQLISTICFMRGVGI